MKLYKGERTQWGCEVQVVNGEGKTSHLSPRLDIANYSPNGLFEWGYNGCGPTQLAIAIVADLTGDTTRTLSTYKQLREMIISKIVADKWELTEPFIYEFI